MENIHFRSLGMHRKQNFAFLAALFFSFARHLVISKLHGCTAPRCVLKLQVELELKHKLKLKLKLELELERTRTQTLC